MRTSVALTALLTGLAGLASPAMGQEAAAPAGLGENGLEEIVVTAQHRRENLQNVPIAVTAITSGILESSGVGNTSALSQVVPSVQFARSGPSGLFFIRGVGQTNAASGEEGSNAIYVDGVYMADLGQTVNYFNNIERIEVLKGPQGTLFGRNATGGLIHVITRDPGNSFAFRAQAGYANYDTISGQAYVGGPVSDQIAMDLALTFSDQRNSWGKNLTTGRDNARQEYWGARSKLVARPSDAVKLTLAGDYFHERDSTALAYDIDPSQIGSGGTRYVPGRDNGSNLDPRTLRKVGGVSLTAEAELGAANLTSITAYRQNRTKSVIDIDGTGLDLVSIDLQSNAKSFSQEVRLASESTDPLGWQVGAFYLHSDVRGQQQQTGLAFAGLGLRGFNIDASQITRSYAVFGELTYAITPTTHLTGGVRYTRDRRKFEGGRAAVAANGTIGALVTQPDPKLSYGEFTYRISLRQDVAEGINVYGSINRGFKAGMFSLQGPTDPPVDPQYIMAYELGLKSQFFDRRLRVNLSAYRYDIDDLQIRSGAGATPGASVLYNAAKSRVNGFDAEIEAAPTPELRLFGAATILDAKFRRFGGPGAQFQAPITYPNYAPVPTTCPAGLVGSRNPGLVGSGTLSGGLTTCFGDVSGNRTPLSPKFTASFGGSYTIAMGEESELTFTALYAYNSGYRFEPDNVYGQGAFSLFNGSVEYRIDQRWAVELWGRNLGNKSYYVQKLTSNTGTATILAPPRTYGVNVKVEF